MDRVFRLENIVEILLENKGFAGRISTDDFYWICKEIKPVLLDEPSVLELEPPIKVSGDIHGQYHDLLRVFDAGGFVPDNRFLFLGDYVDRGENSVEVITLLFALKLLYPNNIYLLRGNHESPEMTESFGFYRECLEKLSEDLYLLFMDIFDCLPIAAIVGKEIFCVHGGLSPDADNVNLIKAIERPTAVPTDGILADLLWSDPNEKTDNWGPNDRGATITWGLLAAKKFLQCNNFTTIIRGHQLANDGYNFPFLPDKSVVTIFTASCYTGRFNNKAAFIDIGVGNKLSYTILPSDIPVVKLSRSSSSETGFAPLPKTESKEEIITIPGTPRQHKK
ncbi:Ser/Thr protein phosphatase, putative [Trichomonas vaginalis G3]|uniref:Serine/threonine-protein phosphatase n=1 Tax=Trichomonas vaginalis (strain ATCC PRA-98 / G3) TaxID=412133 RepID=A2ELV6_TRIV3|nr:phosphoprotein phosphatase protein [Trichomonas vaginalis G3]EAY06384.1 Ser/Thr protein phosphatase, putative [Trichomonas vaginalis G3]KAI5534675.1 phosphoprotein phosphatase protein [Trichomonas vaginalis G3]|eukprot:XP_001318607.1 Ser/Thr protein phosphatase [Trichomonas vaginalis G3]